MRRKIFTNKFWGACLLVLGFLSVSLPANAYFSDEEKSENHGFSLGTLDAEASFLEEGGFSSVDPGEENKLSRKMEIKNQGSLDFQYRIEVRNENGEYCSELELETDNLNEPDTVECESSNLEGFACKAPDALAAEGSETWELRLAKSDKILDEAQECQFDLTVVAWQENLPNEESGFWDEEILDSNEINTGDWTVPEISNIASSDPVGTKGGKNDIIVDITWETDESATSRVYYDTSSHAVGILGDYGSSTSEDSMADNVSHSVELTTLSQGETYYYRVVSEDEAGNEAVSGEEEFEIESEKGTLSTGVVLNEFIPNPEGSDGSIMPAGEWVELFNENTDPVDITNWYLLDADGNKLEIETSNTEGSIESGIVKIRQEGYVVVYDNTIFSLNNAGDTIKLYSDNGTPSDETDDVKLDEYSYGDTASFDEGKTFARIPDGGMWVDPVATPGKPTELSHIPEEQLEELREEAIEECFDEKEYKENSKEETCSREVLHFLELLEEEDDDEINGKFFSSERESGESEKSSKHLNIQTFKQEKNSDQSSVISDQDISGESEEVGEDEGEDESGEENFVEKEVEIEFSGEPELKEGLELEAKRKIEIAELEVLETYEGEAKVEVDLSKLELEEPGEFEFSAGELFDEELLESEKIKLISPKKEDIVWQAEVSAVVEEVEIKVSGELSLSEGLEEDSRDLKIEEIEVSGWEKEEKVLELDLEELDKVEEAGEVEVKIEDLDLEDGAEIVSHDQGEVVLEIEVKEKDEGGKENDGCKELEAVAREDEGVDEEGNNDEGNDNNK